MSTAEQRLEDARNKTNGQFGEQHLADAGTSVLAATFPPDDFDLPAPIRTGPITNLGDLCLTGPDAHRFADAETCRLEDAAASYELDEDVVEDQCYLIAAKRFGDKVARLFPGATHVTLGQRSATNGHLQVQAVEPYGPLDRRNATDSLARMLDDDTDVLNPYDPRFRLSGGGPGPFDHGTVTVPIADLQAISGADLDACLDRQG